MPASATVSGTNAGLARRVRIRTCRPTPQPGFARQSEGAARRTCCACAGAAQSQTTTADDHAPAHRMAQPYRLTCMNIQSGRVVLSRRWPHCLRRTQILAVVGLRGAARAARPPARADRRPAGRAVGGRARHGLRPPGRVGALRRARASTVAVVDSGMRLDHPDLAPNVWTNFAEVPGNGVDDDANGYVDDVHGVDLTSKRLRPGPARRVRATARTSRARSRRRRTAAASSASPTARS